MPLLKLPQNSFTTGVMSPDRIRGRYDIQQYFNAAETLENVQIHPQGGVYRRPGTRFLHDYTGEAIARPITFDFSDDVRHLLVFRVDEIDVWNDDVLAFTILSTGLTEAQIREMDFVQTANNMILVHEDFLPKELIRGTLITSWTLLPAVFDPIPLFGFTLTTSSPNTGITPTSVSGIISIVSGSPAFASTDVGGFITGNGGEARITKFVSTNKVEAKVTVPFVDTSQIPSGAWELETGFEDAWSVTRGFPKSVTYHGDSLIFGGTPSLPDVLWKSAIADRFNFDDTRGFANDSVTFNIKSDRINSIRYMVSSDDLLIFTSDSEFYVTGQITPELNFQVKKQDTRGIRKNVKPVFVDGAPVYADSRSNVVRELVFSDINNKYNSTNLNILSTGIIGAPVNMSHQEPEGDRDADNVYIINAIGTWAVLNTLRRQKTTGFTTGKTENGSLRFMENLEGTMYGIFDRTIDSVAVKYLEKFDDDLTMDTTITQTGLVSATVTGLGVLEGETVGVLADGTVQEDEVVTGGQITLDGVFDTVVVGIKYFPVIKTLPPNRELPDGTMIGSVRRIVAAIIGMTGTHGLEVNGNVVRFRRFGQNLFGNPPPIFSGRKRISLTGGYNRDPTVTFIQDDPLAWHITDLVLEVRVR